MAKLGATPEMIALALEAYESGVNRTDVGKISAHEKRKEWDRQYQARKRLEKKGVVPPPENRTDESGSEGGDHIENLPSSVISIEEVKGTVIAREAPMATRWAAFKSTYPKRAGDYDWKKAQAKYERLVASGVPEQDILDGAMRYKFFCDSEGKAGTQFVRQPPTWLNNEGWKNDYTPSRNNNGSAFSQASAIIRDRIAQRGLDFGFDGDGGPGDETPPY